MPTETNPTCYHISATSIASFKACPQRFRLAYREGLRIAADTESQRIGTNWHALHEIYGNTPGDHEAKMAAAIEHLNQRYAEVPTGFDRTKWELERAILVTSFIAYWWYWQNDPIEFLVSELPFNLPIRLPRSGMHLPLSEVQRVGKIDHVVKWHDAVCSLERKSTTRSIADDSDYWEKSKKDTQVSMYALAFRDMLASGQLVDKFGPFPLKEGEVMPRTGNTLYDVWHKPTIKPCELTQKETAELLDTKTYCGVQFSVVGDVNGVTVDAIPCEVIPGKKGFAIRETVGMYSARLLQDIYERPEFYFRRREIARTDADLAAFEKQLPAIYAAQKSYAAGNNWFENEQQCRATFPCAYIPICYGPGADAVCDGKTTPPGFKRIFVDLTIGGASIDSED